MRDLSRHDEAFRAQVASLNEFANVLASIKDEASAQAAVPRLKAFASEEKDRQKQLGDLFKPTDEEMIALITPHMNELRAVMGRLRQEALRLSRGGGNAEASKFAQQVEVAASQAEKLYAVAAGPPPYVEVYVSGVADSDTADVAIEKLRNLGDSSKLQVQFVADHIQHTISMRVWPVGDAASFAGRIHFGRASATGNRIMVSGLSIPAEEVAQQRAKKQAEVAKALVSAPTNRPKDPEPPPGADDLTVALYRLKSSDQGRIRDGLNRLARMAPDESRKSEVSGAIVPLVIEPDDWTAEAAVKAAGNWPTPEGIQALINVVQRDERSNVRHAAIKKLGELKEESAAPAIATRVKEDWVDAPKALRAIGPGAESAVIPLLRSPDKDERKAACEILKDIGGQATLDTMKKLPADSDTFVRMSAASAMRAITTRVNAQRPSIGKFR